MRRLLTATALTPVALGLLAAPAFAKKKGEPDAKAALIISVLTAADMLSTVVERERIEKVPIDRYLRLVEGKGIVD